MGVGLSGATALAQELSVRVDKPGAVIQPTMWGIFFEDINMAADGGLYAELVKNRSFEFSEPMMGWKGKALVINRSEERPDNPRFVRVEPGAVLVNEGFRGMGIKQGEMYHFSVWTRGGGALAVELQSPSGAVLGSLRMRLKPGEGWHKDTASFVATATEPKARLSVKYDGKGTLDLDMISLFPQHTWRERPGGLRADLVQLLADLRPGFIRFPGGCIVEGRTLEGRYQWKKTVGKVEDRKQIVNRWNTEFAHRPTPDYFQSFGLGFFEYFQLAEDIGASPLPILNCGMACQFNTAEVVPVEGLDPYIQDALDLIEFANGPVSSKWGALRASMGHPESFHLKMMGVGNEQWGPQYVERYKVFSAAIKARYPDVRLVNSVGPNPDGELFDFLNDTLRKMHADILDEHYYRNPEWFLQQAKRYDNYDRSGPRIFAGEYAAQSDKVVSVNNKNNWRSAISEAAFMTGLERNADVVQMASYAPLFAHVEGWQWTPDLIWFDNLRSYGTPDYYVQKLFANNRGSVVVPLTQGGETLTGQGGLYGSACLDNGTGELIVKLVNAGDGEVRPVISLLGGKKKTGKGTMTVLKAGLEDVNSLDAPTAVSPTESAMLLQGNKMTPVLGGHSMAVIRIKI
ncbi:MAG: alpha-L-arabinofuranosidase [Bacteroidetes bacterium]|nr:alpha-L-arabinofuranosidase [Bacteroidota bacterium]